MQDDTIATILQAATKVATDRERIGLEMYAHQRERTRSAYTVRKRFSNGKCGWVVATTLCNKLYVTSAIWGRRGQVEFATEEQAWMAAADGIAAYMGATEEDRKTRDAWLAFFGSQIAEATC